MARVISSVSITGTAYAEKDREAYTVYIIEFSNGRGNQAVSRRFREFYDLDAALRAKGCVCLPALPAKTLTKYYDPQFIEARKHLLEIYLRKLLFRIDVMRTGLVEKFLDAGPQLSTNPKLVRRLSHIDTILSERRSSRSDEKSSRPDEPEARAISEYLVTEVDQINAGRAVFSAVLIPEERAILATTFENSTINQLSNYFTNLFSKKHSEVPLSHLYAFTATESASWRGGVASPFGKFSRTLAMPFRNGITSMCWDFERRWLYLALDDGSFEIYNPSADFAFTISIGKCELLQSRIEDITHVRLTPEQQSALQAVSVEAGPPFCSNWHDVLLVSCGNGCVSVYSPHAQELLATLPISLSNISCSRFDGEGLLYCGTNDQKIVLVNVAPSPPEPIRALHFHSGSIRCMTFANIPEQGKYLISGSFDRTIGVLSVPSSASLPSSPSPSLPPADLPEETRSMSESKDEPSVLTTASHRWECLDGHEGTVTQVCMVPQTSYLLSSDAAGHIVLWDLAARASILAWKAHDDCVSSLQILPDGHIFSSSHDGTLKIWRIESIPQ